MYECGLLNNQIKDVIDYGRSGELFPKQCAEQQVVIESLRYMADTQAFEHGYGLYTPPHLPREV